MPVALMVILTVGGGGNSECYLSKETKTMHVLQMVQEQLSIYFWYALDSRFRKLMNPGFMGKMFIRTV